MDKSDLHDYQTRAVAHILDKPKSALFLDMGLGKTVSTLTAIEDLMYDSFEVNKVLIIAPLRVCNSTWIQEAKKWEHTKDLTFTNLSGGKKQMMVGLQRTTDVYLINRENVKALVTHLKSKWDFDMVIIDESSSFKSASSQRFKALKSILHKISRMVLLTGTPASNGYGDLYSQFYLLDSGERLGRTLSLFRTRYFEKDYMGWNYTLRDGSVKKIQDAIQDLVLSMSAKDYLELPDYIPMVLSNKLEGKLLQQYKKFEKDLILALDGEENITAMSAATLTNKLLQFCSGNMYDENKTVHHFHNLKIDTLKEIIEENPNDNLLVAYNYKHELESLLAAFPDAVVLSKTGKEVEEWNKGRVKILLAHPACVAGDTEVLTEHSGWVKITDVKITDKVFDGVEFVSHSGCIYSGTKEVIDTFGIRTTKDHKFLIQDEWVEAQNVRVSKRTASYRYNGSNEYLSKMLQVSDRISNEVSRLQKTQQTWRHSLQTLYKRHFPQYDRFTYMEFMESDEGKSKKQEGYELWWSWYNFRASLGRFQRVLQGYGRKLQRRFNTGTKRCKWSILQRQLRMGFYVKATEKQAKNKTFNIQGSKNNISRVGQINWIKSMCFNNKVKQRDDSGRSSRKRFNLKLWDWKKTQHREEKIVKERVYDLVDCGKRHRFLVRNKDGYTFIVHNSAGHGLNLQHGGSLIVWYGFTWSLELYQQFNARLHRQGQTEKVRVVHISVGEVEEKLMQALARKDVVQAELLSALK